MRGRVSRRAKTTACSLPFQSGTTCGPLTDSPGVEWWISSLAASRARTSAWRENAEASTGQRAASGASSPESLARYDPHSRSWKTLHVLSGMGLDEFSGTFPRWGMMRSGVCYRLRTPARPTVALGSGSWPTPTATDGSHGGRVTPRKGRRYGNLVEAVSLERFPTPVVADAASSRNTTARRNKTPPSGLRNQNTLVDYVTLFPTPVARTGRNRRPPDGKRGIGLETAVGGQLNPEWVEWLMGWPFGWTALNALEKDRFR